MDKQQLNSREFCQKAGQKINNYPTEPDSHHKILSVKLILEELLEYTEALGLEILDKRGDKIIKDNVTVEFTDSPFDMQGAVDALGDMKYVINGAANFIGIDLDKIEDIIHIFNMKRFGPGSYRREDGKWMKPPDWVPPTEVIKEEIKNQIENPPQW